MRVIFLDKSSLLLYNIYIMKVQGINDEKDFGKEKNKKKNRSSGR